MLSFTFTISISKGIPAQEPNTVRQGGRNDIKDMTRIYLWGVTFPSFFVFNKLILICYILQHSIPTLHV